MKSLKKLLLVGSGDSIFLVDYVKALSKYPDFDIYVYSPHPFLGNYTGNPYKHVWYDNFMKSKWFKIPIIPYIILPFVQRYHFHKYLKGKYFDIIHIHRVLPAWVIAPQRYKRYCDELDITFWGGEVERGNLLCSSMLYLNKVRSLIDLSNKVIGTLNDNKYLEVFPNLKTKMYKGIFGSSIIDNIYKLECSKDEAKMLMGISEAKTTVLLGYSGKALHQHCKILNELICHDEFKDYKDRIHIIASMTRGSNKLYTDEVEKFIKETGCTYTMIKDCYQSENEVALLRKATDVFFQLSTFDGFSASVRENLIASAIMISGSWLPYNVLKEEGFYFEEANSVKEGVSFLFMVMKNQDFYQKKANGNKDICKNKYSWDACISDFVNAYNA